MAGMYRPRHPERTVLYGVLFHCFDRFLTEYESRFEKQSGFLRPIIKEVVERYLDERTGQVRYQYGKEAKETERMDYSDTFICSRGILAGREPFACL
jgi:hypothetical protein